MSISQKQASGHRFWSALFVAVGLFIMAISADLIKFDESSFHAPRWVVFSAGVTSALAGLLLFAGQKSRFSYLLVSVLLLSMGASASWVSLFSSADGFSGGIPLISREANLVVARLLAGLGAFISFGFSAYSFRRFIRHDA